MTDEQDTALKVNLEYFYSKHYLRPEPMFFFCFFFFYYKTLYMYIKKNHQ